MDVIIPDTSAFKEPTADEYVDSIERDGRIGAAQAIRGELWTLRAQLAEAMEAARVLMHAALTRASVVSLEQIQAAIDTVEKWEG
jgi:hypothetical protein